MSNPKSREWSLGRSSEVKEEEEEEGDDDEAGEEVAFLLAM